MHIEVQYGDGKESVDLLEQNLGEIIHPKDLPPLDENSVLEDAFRSPVGPQTLEEFVKEAKDIIVVVNDATRPTPTGRVLESMMPYFEGKAVSYIIATGMHRAPTEEEFRFIFGPVWDRVRDSVHVHDSKTSETSFVGTSRNGTRLLLNRKVVDAHSIIVISSVEPHYFAGYTGGRKSFLPGVSAYETIEQNHKLALRLEAQALRLRGNPVHEDMEDMAKALEGKRIFSVMVVLDKRHRICHASAGHLKKSWMAAIKVADEVFVTRLRKKAEIVVAVTAFPYDIDLYQSQKALDNAKYAVKDGGVIILVSACRMGVGPETFLNLLASASTPKDALEKISHTYKLGYHKAAKMAEIGLKCRMMAVTKLDPEIARKAHMEPVPTLQEAVDKALRELGPKSKVTFIMDAVITVPKVQ